MAWYDILLKGTPEVNSDALNAAYQDTTPLASPWSDDSHLETLTLSSLYGLEPDQMPITRDSALDIAAVLKGRNLICTSIARLPLTAVKNGSPLKTQPQLLQQLQRGTPNFITLSYVVDALIFYGRSFLLIDERTADGRPKSVVFVPEWKAETKDGRLVRAFDKPVSANGYIRIDANSAGLLRHGRDVLRTAKEFERASAEAAANPIPHLILKQTAGMEMSQEDVQKMLSQWSAARRKKYGSVAFANQSVEPMAVGASEENLLIEGLNYSVLQIARALGLPAWALDGVVDGSTLNYSNQSSRNRELLDALAPHIEAIQQTLALFLPYGTEAKFDTSELLKSDTAGRYSEYETALRAGFLTVDEVREKENLEPLPEKAEPAVKEAPQSEEVEPDEQ